jgi:1-acyl-sn-glycerol-3-phosphate acyltransferase
MSLIELLAAPAYHVTRVVLGAAARVYFRRIEVRHADRVPARGPLLVVANHPASFTDVVVLAASTRRRFHFLAMAPTFKPWFRGLALRLCGTLPVYRRQDDPALMDRNDDTFRACHEILDVGGAVLIFPEGTSRTDRSVVKVRTGAARIALGHDARPGQEGKLTVVPIGLHFAERTKFQSDVAVSVGRPIDVAPFRALARTDPMEAVRALTERVQAVLEKLILNVPDSEQASLVAAIERLYREDVRPQAQDVPDLGIARGMAECVEHFSRTDPERIDRAWDRIRRYERRLEELRIRDRAVREMLPARGRAIERLRLVGLGLLGVGPAIVGGLVHYLPYRLSGAARQLTPGPTGVASSRIGAAVLLFPLTYAGIGGGLHFGLHWPPLAIALALMVLAALGLHALVYFQWLAHQRERIRLVFLKASNRRMVAQLRRERRELLELCNRSQREFEAIRGAAPAASAAAGAGSAPAGPI